MKLQQSQNQMSKRPKRTGCVRLETSKTTQLSRWDRWTAKF